jgi:hypothetical protein
VTERPGTQLTRPRARITAVTLVLVVALVAFGTTACASAGGTAAHDATYRNVLLVGTATANAPVVGGRVDVFDSAGKQVKDPSDGPITTDPNGTFSGVVPQMPSSYRVTISGGHVDDQAFTGTLSAEGTSERDVETVSVNLVSTLVDAYQRAKPGTSVATAGLRVAQFLELPPSNRPAELLDAPQSWFNADAFTQAAASDGGLDAYVTKLARRAATDSHAHQAFMPVMLGAGAGTNAGAAGPVLRNAWAEVAKYVGGQLVNGAISYVGGAAFGWLLDKLGIIRSTKSEFELVRDQLAVIQQQLNYITGQLNALMNLIGRVNLDVAVGNLTGVIDQIQTTQDTMNKLLALDPNENGYPIKVERMKQAILDRTQKFLLPGWDTGESLYPFGTTLPNGFFGVAGKTPIPQIVYENVARQGRFFTTARSDAVQQLLGYYALAYVAQFQFVLEWEHVNGRPAKDTVDAYESWTKQWATDRFTSTCAVPNGTTLDTQTNMLWYSSSVPGEVPGAAYLNTAGNKGPGRPLPSTVPPGLPPGSPWPPQQNPSCSSQTALGNWRVATQEQVQKLVDQRPDGTSPADYLDREAGFANLGARSQTFLMTATHGDECTPCYVADWPFPTEDYRTLKTDSANWTWCMPSWKDYGDDHKRLITKGWKGCWTSGVAWFAVRPLAEGEHYLS